MARLEWNTPGKRLFEAGIDRGVLYPKGGNGVVWNGVVWNGLVSVKETPSGGAPTAYYLDGVKYLNASSSEEFEGSIEAFTYPDEFAECDGTLDYEALSFYQQDRKTFDLTYRTYIGNDTESVKHGYKIHIIYNALAQPTSVSNSSLGSRVNPNLFNWKFTTMPTYVDLPNGKSLLVSHLSIDSRKASITQMRVIESILYGGIGKSSKSPSVAELLEIIDGNYAALLFNPNTSAGISPLTTNPKGYGDLIGSLSDGIYEATEESRLIKTHIAGINVLE